jgi:putative transposase
LEGQTPLQRYQRDLPRLRTLGTLAPRLDELFYHRIERKVRRDSTVSYQRQRFEVPYELAGRCVRLVVDPHTRRVLGVEDDKGRALGAAAPLDAVANGQRKRRKSQPPEAQKTQASTQDNAVELAYRQYYDHTQEQN